jgi:hypothetical protein
MSYVLRVVLPDRPGMLGAVATALGGVDADILAMDVVERSRGQAVDDLVVDLPRTRQPDALITAAESVPGVRVESVRPDPGVADVRREWELVEAVAADPTKAVHTLAFMLPTVLRVGWAAVVEVHRGRVSVVATGGGAPDLDRVEPGWAPVIRATVLDEEADWVPESWQLVSTYLAAAPLGTVDATVLVGRPGGPALRASEVARLGHLAGLTAVVAGRTPELEQAGDPTDR